MVVLALVSNSMYHLSVREKLAEEKRLDDEAATKVREDEVEARLEAGETLSEISEYILHTVTQAPSHRPRHTGPITQAPSHTHTHTPPPPRVLW